MSADLYNLRPLEEWNEDHGDVLWWKFPVTEAPWVGSPTCLGQTVEIHACQGVVARGMVGGWPGYHTHWTPLPDAAEMERRAKALVAASPDGGEVGEKENG